MWFVSEKRLSQAMALARAAEGESCHRMRMQMLAEDKAVMAQARVATLEDRVAELQGELMAVRSQEPLPGVPVDRCPDCGGEEWVRIASIVRAQHDGRVERVSLGGSRLMCLGCSAHYNLLPSGLTKPPVAQPQSEAPTGKPRDRDRIPVKMPGGRSL